MGKIFSFLLLLAYTQIAAQSGRLFKGSINKSISITFYLDGLDEGTNADGIIGIYKYDTKKEYILLNGYRNNNGNISLIEQSTANFSGTFLGTLTKNKITGKWISANQKEMYQFELTEIKCTREQVTNFQKEISNKGNEFRDY